MSELFKGKGSQMLCVNHREVYLGDYTGKSSFQVMRKRYLAFACTIVGSTQYGSGFNGGETAGVCLYVRLCHDYASSFGMSSSALYIDVASAFASLYRKILFDTDAFFLAALMCCPPTLEFQYLYGALFEIMANHCANIIVHMLWILR